jgi:hypothetical protein
MAKRRRSGAPKLKGSFTFATSNMRPMFFRSAPEGRHSIGIGPKNKRAGPQKSPFNHPEPAPFTRDCGISAPQPWILHPC